MQIQLACQTITWGDGQSERFDGIFSAVKAAGFDGVEIGFRHIREVRPAELLARLVQRLAQTDRFDSTRRTGA